MTRCNNKQTTRGKQQYIFLSVRIFNLHENVRTCFFIYTLRPTDFVARNLLTTRLRHILGHDCHKVLKHVLKSYNFFSCRKRVARRLRATKSYRVNRPLGFFIKSEEKSLNRTDFKGIGKICFKYNCRVCQVHMFKMY